MFKKITLTFFVLFLIAAVILPSFSLAGFGQTLTYFGKIYSGDGKKAKFAYLDTPQDFVKDRKGNFYIADTMNNVIRKINAKTKKVSTIAGNGDFGAVDGAAVGRATFSFPEGLDIDHQGNIYIADTASGKVRKYDKRTKTVFTLFSGLSKPKDVMIRGNELFIADTGNNRILRSNTAGGGLVIFTQISSPRKLAWGNHTIFAASEGVKGVIGISLITGRQITVFRGAKDFGGIFVWKKYLYVVESDNGVWNRLWRVNLANLKTKRLHKILETELINYPSQVLIKEKGVIKIIKKKIKKKKKIKILRKRVKVYVPEIYILFSGGSSIYKFGKTGKRKSATRLAGKHRFAQEMKKREFAEAGRPKDLSVSRKEKMYFSANNQIFVYNFKSQKLSHLAGHPMDSYTEGTGDEVRLSDPTGIVLSRNEKILYIIDRNNNRVRKLNLKTRQTFYITGAGEINSSNESQNGYQEGGSCQTETRKAVSGCAYFNRPTGIALSRDGKNLYIADASNNRVRKVNIKTGQTSLLAGSGAYGYADGPANQAQFRGPYSLALAPSGRYLNVTDKYNHAIRAIDLVTGQVSTLVGGPQKAGYGEGPLWQSRLSIPEYLKFGPDGNLYFTEAGNLRIRLLDFNRDETRLVSGSGRRGIQNGQPEFSRFNNPKGFAFAFRKIYLADFYNDLIREIAR
jgi:DNA-binding beta-propeller fold protein YncE